MPPTPDAELPEDRPRFLHSRYSRIAVEWILVGLFAGLVAAILGVAAAVVFWAWSS